MQFINECNCIVDFKILEGAIKEECKRRNIVPKDEYKIYLYRGYAGISLKHDKVSVHRIIGKYIVGFDFDSNVAVHHIDGNKLNNDISNLQVIRKEFHTKEHYLVQYADKDKLRENALKGTEKITRNDITTEKVLELKNKGLSVEQIAKELKCGVNTIGRRLGKKY
jgi:hypothetical protein